MKKAFTLLELVLVVVVIGIISAVMIPRISNVQIDKAARQVLDHIRYTQHLAMMDNQFDPDDANWYKKRWQIRFQTISGKIVYTIFKDQNSNGTISQNEIARNPLHKDQLLTGDKSISINSGKYSKKLNLSDTYNISSINMTGCISSKRLYFDYIGRPMAGNPASLDRPYYEDNQNRLYLLKQRCKITLHDADRSVTIAIEPETGYVHLL